MDFWSQVVSTLIGVMAGFIFSVLLFYLTEQWKNARQRKQILRNVQKEFEYNITLLETLKNQLGELSQDLANNQQGLWLRAKFRDVQRTFIFQAFNEGLLYEQLTPSDISRLNSYLVFFTDNTDAYVYEKLKEYESSQDTQMKAELHGTLKFNKTEVSDAIDFFEQLQKTLQQK